MILHGHLEIRCKLKNILYFPIILARRFFRVNIFLTIQCLIFSTGQLDWQTMSFTWCIRAFRARFRIQSNGLAEGFPQPRMVSVEKRAQGQKQRCKKPVRGTPGFLHLVFDLRYCQIRYPPRFAIVIRGELWHLTVNKIMRDISHNPRVMTSNG